MTPGSTYGFQVRAVNATGQSAWAGPVFVQVPTIPNAPTGLALTQIAGPAVRVSWVDNANNETGYEIWKNTNGGAYSLLTTTAANVTSFNDSAVIIGNTYGYEVRAVNLSGASAYAGPATIIVTGPPNAPSGLTLTLLAGPSIRLNWVDNSNNESGFQVWRSVNGGAFTQVFTTVANATTWTNTGLTAGSTYAYEVRATNIYGNSAFAGPVSLTIPTIPAAPTGLTATLQTGPSIKLTWVDNATNETGYQIYRSVNGGTFLLFATTGPNITTYTNSGLTPGTTYAYQVRATGISGNSAFAGPVSVTVPTIPAAPSGLQVTRFGTTTANIRWTDNSNNELGFQIYRSVNGGAYSLLTTTAANATSYQDANLITGVVYSYEVRAYNLGGNSAFAGPVAIRM